MIEVNLYYDGMLLGTWDLDFVPKKGDEWDEMRFLSVIESMDGSDYDIEIEYL
jgi:hypothetical protein